jgi:23S rRNA pseudouridine1911/1915/1917 synthase
MKNQTPEILLETPFCLVVNKPPGVLSQPDRSGDRDCAALILQKRADLSFLHPAHRLDRNTSGILLLAKSPESAHYFQEHQKEWQKIYLAIVKGRPHSPKGEWCDWLLKNGATNEVRIVEENTPGAKEAHLSFKVLHNLASSSLLEIELGTGRSHQIRVQCASRGHYLLGDRKYGKGPWVKLFHRPALHATKLAFSEPNGKKQKVEAPLPEDFSKLLNSFRRTKH